LIWVALVYWYKRLSVRIRQGENDIIRYVAVHSSINIGIKHPSNQGLSFSSGNDTCLNETGTYDKSMGCSYAKDQPANT
jgi:hypothetical protein